MQPVVYVRPTEQFEALSTNSRNGDRTSLVRSLIHSTNLESHCTVVKPRRAHRWEALLGHSQDYLATLHQNSREAERDAGVVAKYSDHDEDLFGGVATELSLEEAGLVDDCPVFPGMWDVAMITAGGTLTAVEHLLRGESMIACWFDGGRHHAAVDSAHGFCYLNDVIIATKVLLTSPSITKVFYVDMDIHFGDGVENAFLYTNDVVTLSLHLVEPGFYPGTGQDISGVRGTTEASAIRVPLRRGIDDALYLSTFKSVTTLLFNHHKPDVVVVQCGVDGLCGDPLGGFNLTGTSFAHGVKHILSFQKPTLILGGGGYCPANAARVWTDVLECCIQVNASTPAGTRKDGSPDFVKVSRDIPLSDEFFERYGPAFSRDIAPMRIRNENRDDEIRSVLDKIARMLKQCK